MMLTHTQLAALRALAFYNGLRGDPVYYSRQWVWRGRAEVTSAGWEHYWERDIPGGLRTVLALVSKGLVEAEHEVAETWRDAWANSNLSKQTFAAGDPSEEEYNFSVSALGRSVLGQMRDDTLPHRFGEWRHGR